MNQNPDDETPDFSEKIQPDSERVRDITDPASEANDSEFDDDVDDAMDEDEAEEK